MQTDMQAAIRLGLQLAAEDASPTEITDAILNAFEDDAPRSAAFKLAFADRVRLVQTTRRSAKER